MIPVLKPASRTRSSVLLLLVLGLAGCPPEGGPDQAREGPDTATSPPSRTEPGQVHGRNVVFVATEGDSTLLVPWIFNARTRPGGVEREARAWLDRNGSWERFFEAQWGTAPTRAPWRLLPQGPLRLVVGDGDALQRIVYEEGARSLEVLFGPLLAEWSGSRGQRLQVYEGSAVLSGERLGGVIFEAALVRRAEDTPHGDWAFVTSGDSTQLVLYDPSPEDPPSETSYRGLARVGEEEHRWPLLQVEWTAARAFQRARRDVPVQWSVRSPDGNLVGSLETVTSEISAGEGGGPLLPVDALFQVRGTMAIGGRAFPVRGLFRHTQR